MVTASSGLSISPPPPQAHTHVYSTYMYTRTHSHKRALTHRASVPSQLAPQAPGGRVCPHHGEEVSVRPPVGQGQGLGLCTVEPCLPQTGVWVPCSGRRPRSDTAWHSPLFSELQVLSSEFPASFSVVDMFYTKLLFTHHPYCYCSQWGD